MTASGWPWMKGSAVAIAAEPIPPVNERDDRPALKDLFTEHRALMDKVAAELSMDPHYDATKHDDLWIVRFLLSHKKNVKAAVKAATYTLAFRAKHNLDDKDIRYSPIGPDVPNEAFQRYQKYCSPETFQIVIPDDKLGVIGFVKPSHIDQAGLVKNVDEADWLPSFIYVAEWSHQWADYLSRKTGRLTASIRIVDLSGYELLKVNAECNRRDGRAMKVTEDCYPQMLKSLFVCHSPSWMQVLWRMLRPLFPRRVVEKTDMIAPETNEKERDRLLKFIALENLPARYGGQNNVWPLNFSLPS